MSFGNIIATARKAKELRQVDLGDLIGRSDSFIAHLEKEARVPNEEMVILLSRLLDLTDAEQNELALSAELARGANNQKMEAKRQELKAKKGELHKGLASVLTVPRVSPTKEIQSSWTKSVSTGSNLSESEITDTLMTDEEIGERIVNDEKYLQFLQKITWAYDHPELRGGVLWIANLAEKSIMGSEEE
jgi:transcriptional regulator with XRE-family HTH domain